MLSKKQADAAGDAILELARRQRDRESVVLSQFPELAEFSASERSDILKGARDRAWRCWPTLAISSAIILLAAAWIWMLVNGLEGADSFWPAPLVAAFSYQFVLKSQTRKQLRQMRKGSPAQDQ
jgi:hypothetical protein